MTEKSPKPKRRKVDVDLSQTEGDDEICPSNAHSTLSAKLSSAEEDVHSLLNLPLEDAAEAGKFKLSVLARLPPKLKFRSMSDSSTSCRAFYIG